MCFAGELAGLWRLANGTQHRGDHHVKRAKRLRARNLVRIPTMKAGAVAVVLALAAHTVTVADGSPSLRARPRQRAGDCTFLVAKHCLRIALSLSR